MNSFFRGAAATLLNLVLLIEQSTAELAKITFESGEWTPIELRKGQARNSDDVLIQHRDYTYNAAGFVTADSKRTYAWTSYGQLSSLDDASAPELQDFAGTVVHAPGRVLTDFQFAAAGDRALQVRQRIALDDSRKLENTLYLGAYEREEHLTRPTPRRLRFF